MLVSARVEQRWRFRCANEGKSGSDYILTGRAIMGGRSTFTTKSGKYMNPTDRARKSCL